MEAASEVSPDGDVVDAALPVTNSVCPSSNGSFDAADGSPPTATPAPGKTLVTLATGQTGPYYLAVDGASVYWAAQGDGTVMKVPLQGGTPTVLASGQRGALGLAVDATSVYFVSVNALAKVPLDGGPVVSLATGFINDPIAVGPNGVYGTDGQDDLVSAPLGAGATATLAAGPGDSNTYGIAIDATDVYWTDFRGTATLRKVPIGGGAIADLATTHVAFGVAIDATNVYWLDDGLGPNAVGRLMKVPKGGGAPTVLASCIQGGISVAIDANHAYVTMGGTGGGGSVVRIPLAGGAATTLVTGLEAPNGIAVDDTSVYFTTLGVGGRPDGSVMKLTPK